MTKPPLRVDYDMVFEQLANNIKNLMIEQDVSQERLTKLSGVKKSILDDFLVGYGDILLGDLVDIFFVLKRKIRLELINEE